MIRPGGKQHHAAVGAIDLLLEEQVGGDALGLRGMDAARAVEEGEVGDGRRAVVVADAEPDRDGRAHVEEDRHLAAEAEVLRPLADVEADRRLSLARLAAVEQGQGVLDPQAARGSRSWAGS